MSDAGQEGELAAVPAAAQLEPAAPALALAAAPLGPGPPAGIRLAASSEVLTGTALVGQAVIYRWPVPGLVAAGPGDRRVLTRGVLLSTAAIGSAAVPFLLDAASHGPAGRWLLLRRITPH